MNTTYKCTRCGRVFNTVAKCGIRCPSCRSYDCYTLHTYEKLKGKGIII